MTVRVQFPSISIIAELSFVTSCFSSSLSINLCSAVISSVRLNCRVECLSWEALQRFFQPLSITPAFFIPSCSTFHCIFTPIHASFLLQALHCCASVPLSPSHSWIGHTQGSNESTQWCLQDARFHRPSWIPVTMEISTTVVTHTERDVVLLTPQTPNAFILKNLYSGQCVSTRLHRGSSDPQEDINAGTKMPTIPFQPTQRYGSPHRVTHKNIHIYILHI